MLPELDKAIKEALLSKNSHKAELLRMLKSALLLAQKENGNELTGELCVEVARKQIKMRMDAAEAFEKANMADKATKERAEAKMIAVFMPEQMDEQQLRELVDAEFLASGIALERKNMGQLIGHISAKVGDQASKADIAKIINQKLQ